MYNPDNYLSWIFKCVAVGVAVAVAVVMAVALATL